MQSRLFSSTSRLVSRYGKDVDYVVTTEGTYDIDSGSMTAETTSTSSIKAFRTKISYSESQNPSLIGKDSTVYFIAGASIDFVPDVGDRIIDDFDDSDYQVSIVTKINVQDAVALWRLVCVRS